MKAFFLLCQFACLLGPQRNGSARTVLRGMGSRWTPLRIVTVFSGGFLFSPFHRYLLRFVLLRSTDTLGDVLDFMAAVPSDVCAAGFLRCSRSSVSFFEEMAVRLHIYGYISFMKMIHLLLRRCSRIYRRRPFTREVCSFLFALVR